MFQKSTVQEALRRTRVLEENPEVKMDKSIKIEDSVVSLLIYDIFGGEILKTHKRKGWHYYNRVEGERIDFARKRINKFSKDDRFEDIPSNPDEIYNLLPREDYSTFFMRFVRVFEEAVGLERQKPELTA